MNRNKFAFISRKTQNFTSKTLADIEQIKKALLPVIVNCSAQKLLLPYHVKMINDTFFVFSPVQSFQYELKNDSYDIDMKCT